MTADHERFDELAVGWALHALEPEDETEFTRHLSGCARCAETVAETTEVMGAMAADLPQAEPSEALRVRLAAAVQATEQVQRPPVPPRQAEVPRLVPVAPGVPAARRRPLAITLVAAAVAAVVGLGLWNVALNSDRRDLQAQVAEQSKAMAALLSPDGTTVTSLGADGRPVATVVPRGEEVQVVSYGLSENETASTTYVLWGLDGDETNPLGTFDVERSQIELKTVGSGLAGLDDFTSFAISLEPGREAPSTPTEVVATGQVTS
ncbi:anti-sigma-K factor rskA [Blastococcus colisei]|uniref:Regulator of SigK n=1 Tax=Blastococcus colisei TaxID=1564162 RepID=A0A543PGX3_9ACTN|nr:anti-sigma factor [Blastococcus colisei]TQN43330.1 anti-sigma-K factor rskA [Blastococcus colisei]